jgi:hypothetical protein
MCSWSRRDNPRSLSSGTEPNAIAINQVVCACSPNWKGKGSRWYVVGRKGRGRPEMKCAGYRSPRCGGGGREEEPAARPRFYRRGKARLARRVGRTTCQAIPSCRQGLETVLFCFTHVSCSACRSIELGLVLSNRRRIDGLTKPAGKEANTRCGE